MPKLVRINVGCGQTPTAGWHNFDNSPSILLARIPFLPDLLRILHLIGEKNYQFIRFAASHNIRYANATRGLPVPDGYADVIYTSHMLEHLDQQDADAFLREARRILAPEGVIRVSVPDLRRLTEGYLAIGDADRYIASTLMCVPHPRTFSARLQLTLVGPRHHVWMYDVDSLSRLLRRHGFVDPVSLPAGATTISDPGPLNLRERDDESLYLEARAPH